MGNLLFSQDEVVTARDFENAAGLLKRSDASVKAAVYVCRKKAGPYCIVLFPKKADYGWGLRNLLLSNNMGVQTGSSIDWSWVKTPTANPNEIVSAITTDGTIN